MGVSVKIDDQQVLAALDGLVVTFGRNPTRVLQAMGRYGKSSTQLRFRTQTGPDGKRWKPSKRAQDHNGQTLRMTGRMRNSIAWQLTADGVEWGTNVKHAAAHQLGIDDDRQKVKAHWRAGRRKRTTQAGARVRFPVRAHTRHMRLPARPFLGVNDWDRQRLLDIIKTEVLRQIA